MGHEITAYIVPERITEHLAGRGFQHLHLLRLKQGFVLVPVIFELYREIEEQYPGQTVEGESWTPSHGIVAFGKELSHHAPVAYVETHYWGGSGTQAAVAWKDGETVLDPQESKWSAINNALSEIGVERVGDSDRFDSLGLDRYRTLSDCVEAAIAQVEARQELSEHHSEDATVPQGPGTRLMNLLRKLMRKE